MGDKQYYKAKCAELEEIVELCMKALQFIPTNQLRLEYTWMPSKETLRDIEKAKDAVKSYGDHHWRG